MIFSLPSHVLLLTGYWPVVGEGIAICVCDGPTVLLVPEDEEELAGAGIADSVETFVPETVEHLRFVGAALKPRLADVLRKLNSTSGTLGVESGAVTEAASVSGHAPFWRQAFRDARRNSA